MQVAKLQGGHSTLPNFFFRYRKWDRPRVLVVRLGGGTSWRRSSYMRKFQPTYGRLKGPSRKHRLLKLLVFNEPISTAAAAAFNRGKRISGKAFESIREQYVCKFHLSLFRTLDSWVRMAGSIVSERCAGWGRLNFSERERERGG